MRQSAKKRWGLWVLAILLIFAFSAQAETLEEYLKTNPDHELWAGINGSTATIPLTRAIIAHFQDVTQPQLDLLVHHDTTPTAYENLHLGEAELILVTEPFAEISKEFQAEMAEEGMEIVPLEVAPIARDALVLLNNRENPVKGLTRQQAVDMYSGKITNWSQVGGNDEPVTAYQRPLGSGSQTLFLQHLMRDVAPMEPLEYQVISTMGYLIDAVADYQNAQSALGYSVYYYAANMYGNEHIRMLAVDGVEPNAETIAMGEYPLCTYYYGVVRQDLPSDHPARLLLAWLLTEEGQAVVQAAGYIPLSPADRQGGQGQ